MANIDNNFDLLVGDLDFYRILGVSMDASLSEIKNKYRELTRQYHPDKAKSEDMKETNAKIYEKIKLAYQILSDSNLRDEYTKLLQSTFESLKEDYKSCSKMVEQESICTFNQTKLDQFNEEFLKSEKVETPYFNTNTNEDFEKMVEDRESINIENKFDGNLKLDQVKDECNDICQKLNMKLDQLNPDNEDQAPLHKALSTLHHTFTQIGSTIQGTPFIVIDFLVAVKKLSSFKINYDSELVQYISEKLDYQEPEWAQSNASGLTPFNTNTINASKIDHHGSLLK